MLKVASVFLSLFAASTLISQSAMDVFSTLFALVVLLLIVRQPEYRQHLLRTTGLEWIVGLWFFVTVLGLWQGSYLVDSPQWQKLADFKWLVFAVMIGRHLSFIRPQIKTVLYHWNIFSVGCLWAIAIFFLGYDPIHPGHTLDVFADGTVRSGGFLQQAIVFAQLYGLWLMIPLGLLIQDLPQFSHWRRHTLSWATLVDAVMWGSLAILLSFTRGIWLAVPVATLLLLAIKRWTWSLGTMLVGAASVVGLMEVWPLLQSRVLQAFQGGDSERLWIWKANWQMFLEHPWLGVGYNHNVQLIGKYYEVVGAPMGLQHSHAHNQFLHILTGLGVSGFLFFMAFWFLLIRRGFRLYKRSLSDHWIAGLSLGIMGSLFVFLIGGLFESNFEHSKMRWTMALVLGLLFYAEDYIEASPK